MVRLASAVSLSGRKVISRRQRYLVYIYLKLLSHVRPSPESKSKCVGGAGVFTKKVE